MKKVFENVGKVAVITAVVAAVAFLIKMLLEFKAAADFINHKEGYFEEDEDCFEDDDFEE